MSLLRYSLFSLTVLSALNAWANPTPSPTHMQIKQTLSQAQTLQQSAEKSSLTATQREDKWSEWGLTETDWTRYEKLKESPIGIYTPNLDPLTMLGIEARSEAERTRYAELLARKEFERNEKILAFQLAYDAAFTRLYPHILPFKVEEPGAENAAPSPQRIIYFTRSDCGQKCDDNLKRLFAYAGNAPIDIYVVDSGQDDDKIRKWAVAHQISAEKVRTRQITLNHDKGMWLKHANGKMPAAFRIQGEGQWQRIAY